MRRLQKGKFMNLSVQPNYGSYNRLYQNRANADKQTKPSFTGILIFKTNEGVKTAIDTNDIASIESASTVATRGIAGDNALAAVFKESIINFKDKTKYIIAAPFERVIEAWTKLAGKDDKSLEIESDVLKTKLGWFKHIKNGRVQDIFCPIELHHAINFTEADEEDGHTPRIDSKRFFDAVKSIKLEEKIKVAYPNSFDHFEHVGISRDY